MEITGKEARTGRGSAGQRAACDGPKPVRRRDLLRPEALWENDGSESGADAAGVRGAQGRLKRCSGEVGSGQVGGRWRGGEGPGECGGRARARGALDAAGGAIGGASGAAGVALSAAGLRALRQLAAAAAAPEAAGAEPVMDPVMAAGPELVRHDLVRWQEGSEGAAGCWVITAPGFNYLRRLEEGRRLRRLAATLDSGAVGEPGADRVTAADLADSYRAQHGDFALEDGAPVAGEGGNARRLVNRGESTLGWLRRRRDKAGRPLVSERQFAAGERLRADFERAGLQARVTVSWNGAAAGGRHRRDAGVPDPTEAQIMARQRYRRALTALGPGLGEVATRVCCYQEGLAAVERSKAWPVRSAKVVLGLALDQLADFYGIG